MSFEKLLAELDGLATEAETMRKALPADGKDDDEIRAAAGEGGDADGDENDDENDEGDEGEGAAAKGQDKAGKDTAPPFGKSMTLVNEAGENVEAYDGTELVKSLMVDVAGLQEKFGASESVMAKALEGTLGLVKTQGELIKSLSAQVSKLSSSGRGRQAVLTVSEKPAAGALAKSVPAGMSGQEVLAKALTAQRAGKITGLEVSRLENAINAGMAPQAEILSRIQ
jgi:hypothetical protein